MSAHPESMPPESDELPDSGLLEPVAPAITAIEQVTFDYQPDEDATPDLQVAGVKNITLDFPPGSCTLITGPSGSGKSTLLKLLNGLIPELFPGNLEGKVRLGGLDTREVDIQILGRAAGTVFQNPRSQFFTATVFQELAFSLENAGENPEVIWENLEAAAKTWGIEDFLGRKIARLSGGEQQLVASAVALAGPQRIVLFDEPTSNLSPEAIGLFTKILRDLKRQGFTIVVAEHRLYPLREIADRVVVMREGQVIEDMPAGEFFAGSDTHRRELGLRILSRPQERCFQSLLESLPGEDSGGIPVHEVISGNPGEVAMPSGADNPRRAPHEPPATTEAASGIVAENLRFSYGKTPVLNIDHLEIPAGQVTALTGPNGAGKTTLARVLIGLAHPDKATRIFFGGQRARSWQRTKRSTLVMQDVNRQLFGESVAAEVALGNTGVSAETTREVLRELGLAGLENRHPMTLSGGQKQRLVIANAIVGDCELYVFDEPTSGVDYGHLMSISRLLRRLAQRGKAVMVISHDWEFLNEVADRELRLVPLTESAGSGQLQGG